MSTSTADQIEAIKEMMARGHRSVRLEPHTLFLWGIAAALLIVFTEYIFTRELFPNHVVRTLSSTAFIAAVLTVIGYIDFHKTRSIRRDRDETLSFVQLQLTKVWWLLIALIVLLNLGMNLFGGNYLYFGLMLAIIGLAFYIHGLFSEQMLTWVGLSLMILGVASLVLNLPFPLIKWLAAITLGLGLPLLALTMYRPQLIATNMRRVFFTLGWLAAVIGPTWIVYQVQEDSSIPVGQVLSMSEYSATGATPHGQTIVRLPAGTEVPVHIELGGNIVNETTGLVFPVHLSKPIDVVLTDGKLDGRYRVDGADWKKRRFDFRVFVDNMQTALAPGKGMQVNLHIRVHSKKKH